VRKALERRSVHEEEEQAMQHQGRVDKSSSRKGFVCGMHGAASIQVEGNVGTHRLHGAAVFN
jgi:hypothetical protein